MHIRPVAAVMAGPAGKGAPVGILIIDDQPAMRAGMRQQILADWPHADVEEAPTLARGLALCQQGHRPALIVVDLALPDASGTEGIARLFKGLGQVTVLALSPESDFSRASRLLEMGVVDYLPRSELAGECAPALCRVLSGGRFVTGRLSARFLRYLVDLDRR